MKNETAFTEPELLPKPSKPLKAPAFFNRIDKGFLFLVLIFFLTLPLFTPRVYASDEIKYFSYLHSIFFDHDVDFTNEYSYFYNSNPNKYEDFKKTVLDKRNENNLPPNEGPVGSALMWSPFYLAAHGLTLAGNTLGFKSLKADGYSTPYIWAVTLGSLLYGFLGLILAYRLVRQFVPNFYAALATGAIWLASPVIFYMSLTPPMSHANSLFMISLWLSVWYNTRGWDFNSQGDFSPGRRPASRWLLLGVLGGLMTMVREQDGTILIAAALESLFLYYFYWKKTHQLGLEKTVKVQFRQEISRLFIGNLSLLLGLAVSLVPQLIVYQALNGHPGPSKIVGDKLGFFNPSVFKHLFLLLFDPDHGLFFWSPILLPAVAGLFLMLREKRLRLVTIALIAAFFLELYVSASFQTWKMSGSFAPRRLVGISPAFIAGLAYLGYLTGEGLKGLKVSRKWQSAAVLLFIIWNFGLILQFSAIRTPEDRQNLDFPRVVGDQFTAVPGKFLSVTQKFFFNRNSLYKQ